MPGQEKRDALRQGKKVVDKNNNLVSQALIFKFITLTHHFHQQFLKTSDIFLIVEGNQTFNSHFLNCRPEYLETSADQTAPKILTHEHDFHDQMQDSPFAEFLGQLGVHHHVADQLKERVYDPSLVAVVVQ